MLVINLICTENLVWDVLCFRSGSKTQGHSQMNFRLPGSREEQFL